MKPFTEARKQGKEPDYNPMKSSGVMEKTLGNWSESGSTVFTRESVLRFWSQEITKEGINKVKRGMQRSSPMY